MFSWSASDHGKYSLTVQSTLIIRLIRFLKTGPMAKNRMVKPYFLLF